MAKTRGTGLLMLWTDVDPEHEAELNRWYDEEHLAHLLRVPGFLGAARYVAVKGGPKYLAMYELEEPGVLRTTAFLDEVRYKPSPWRQKASGGHVGRNYILNAYRQIFPARTHPVENTMEAPPWLQMGRMDIPAYVEEEFHAWYDTCYIPGFLAVPGCLRVRRFVVIDGQPKYLTVYELEDERVPESGPWQANRLGSPWSKRVRPLLQLDEGSPGLYRRINPK
jgi:hypothetical protein